MHDELEDGPCGVRLCGAEGGEVGECDVWGDEEGNFGSGLLVGLGEVRGGEDGVGAGEGGKEGGGVGFLVVLGWGCGGDGTVFDAGKDEVLGCRYRELGRYEAEVGIDVPSGILRTVQPFKKAIVIACKSIKVFPLPLSPTNTRLIAFL